MADEIIASQAASRQDEAKAVNLLSLVVTIAALLVGLFSAVAITRAIKGGVARAIHIAEAVAVGDVSRDVTVDSTDEIGKLLAALDRMIRAERDAAEVAESLSQGDLTVSVVPRSEKDALLTSMGDMRLYSATEDKKYYESGLRNLAEVKRILTEAKALSDKYPDLVKLRENVAKTQTKIAEYEKLLQDTAARMDTMPRQITSSPTAARPTDNRAWYSGEARRQS